MLFKEIIGQSEVKQRLIKSVKENRVSHAQLFLGAPGSGNLALAYAYAQYLSCENKEENDSCGVCMSCIKFNKLVHPDIHFTYPVNTKKNVSDSNPKSIEFVHYWRSSFLSNPYLELNQWLEELEIENKQGFISVHEVLDIIKKISLKTVESEFKTVIIWMPERLRTDASNKILKALEEPPPKTLFLLVANSQDQLLQTILSRTQIVKVPRLSDEEISSALQSRFNADEKTAITIAHLSDGNWNEALTILNDEESAREQSSEYLNWMRSCYAYEKKIQELITSSEDFADKKREKQKLYLQFGLHIIRECLMINRKQDNLIRLSQDDRSIFEKFSQFVRPDNCELMATEFSKAYLHIERNANPKILFLDLSFKIGKLLKS